MKKEEQTKARFLRQDGQSINQIAETLGVAKGSVSKWTRDIELTPEQRSRLSERGRSVESVEKRRLARLSNEKARRMPYFDEGVTEVQGVTKEQLWFIGCGLYWGEGSKTKRGTVSFTNSDPRSVQVMMRFFREVCEVPEEKFRGHVILHPHLNEENARSYWSKISGIPSSQFYKTTMQHNKASKNKKDSLPLGTFSVDVHDTTLYLRLMGWMEGMYSGLVTKETYLPCKYHQFL